MVVLKTRDQELVDLKQLFMVQIIRDILIDSKLVTREDFKEKLKEKVNNAEIDQTTKEELMKFI